jgi:hypothetical protein
MASSVAGEPRIIATCQPVSAAVNRNLGLDQAFSEVVLMVDDDVTKFPAGWNLKLEQLLCMESNAVMVSAHLLTTSGQPAQMLGDPERKERGVGEVTRRELPTACIALWNDGLRFDEQYVGSGWEDTHFCAALKVVYPEGRFLVDFDVAVVHLNEMKRQGVNFSSNRTKYESVWGKHCA